ncbi:MAG: hypothetical protein Q9190_005299, partial [Brigantiaea leucoxantha]
MPSANTPAASSSSSLNNTKPFSISLSTAKIKVSAAPSTANGLKPNPRKRPHSSLRDSDSETEGTEARGNTLLVSSFDQAAGGAIGVNGVERPKAPLVIQGPKNRDWREESRRRTGRGRNLLPADVQAASLRSNQSGDDTVERDEVSQQSGLRFVGQEDDGKDQDGDIGMSNSQEKQQNEPGSDGTKSKTADEEALQALTGDGGKKSTLILPAPRSEGQETNGRILAPQMSEGDYYRSDVASRPDSASLEEYAAVPVEEFGAALLRGMGWKEGEVVGKRKDQISKARIVERRPALLGIGAKEVPSGVGEELGAWGKVTKGKKGKVDKTYNPVLLKNTKTGEMLTEEELQNKKETQKKEEQDWRERRDRNLAIDEEKKKKKQKKSNNNNSSEKRRGDREQSPSSYNHRHPPSSSSSSKRHRSRSSDRKHITSSSSSSSSRRERSRSADRQRRRDSSRTRHDEEYDKCERDRRRRA